MNDYTIFSVNNNDAIVVLIIVSTAAVVAAVSLLLEIKFFAENENKNSLTKYSNILIKLITLIEVYGKHA